MLKKIFNFFYLIFVIVLAIIAFALGAANNTEAQVVLGFVKVDTTIAIIMACAMLFGAFLISLVWIYIVLKLNVKNMLLNKQINNLTKEVVQKSVVPSSQEILDNSTVLAQNKDSQSDK